MILHPRERIVRKAENELIAAIHGWLKKNDLTTIEELAVINHVLGNTIAGTLKMALRQERHGNTDDPAGVAREEDDGQEWGPGARGDAGDSDG